MSILRYFFKEALASFSRGGAMSLVAVLALCLASLALGAYERLRANTLYWLSQAERRFEVVAYLKDGTDEPAARQAAEQMKALPGVDQLRLVSPAEAAAEVSKDEVLAGFLQALGGENPLPWSVRVNLKEKNPASLAGFAAAALKVEGVAEADWGREGAEAVLRWLRLLRAGLLALGAALGLSAVLVTASVIRLTVYARRGEIAIMRMVGASPAFIRIPLLLEGMLQGLLGGALAAGLHYGVLRLLEARAATELELDLGAYLPFGVTPLFALGLLGLGAGLGFLGSLTAVARGFKEEE